MDSKEINNLDNCLKYIMDNYEKAKKSKLNMDKFKNNIDEDTLLKNIKSYLELDKRKDAEDVLDEIRMLSHEELGKSQVIAKMLGYGDFDNYDEVGVFTKGYRVLNKIPRMPSNIVENLVKTFKSFQHILAADIPSLDAVEGIGEVRARAIRQSLRRMQEQFVFDNLML